MRGARLECPSPQTHARRGFAPAGTPRSPAIWSLQHTSEMSSSSLPVQRGPRVPRRDWRSSSRQCKFLYCGAWAGCRAHLSAGELLRTLQPLKVSLLGREVCVLAWRFLFLFVVVRDIDPVKSPHPRALESECAVASLG